ncbi:carotenoid 1,2-hydratase [Schlegelella sp. S2-27]|uniref:Carotenoid 1,2-hydratase n=1 Tax=Caldimonas mangrovi TaxID=2944811 RepID=A0ABT0YND3_9BURK|nr:carotenoid 1,2-hydratase [Caldimonas mangrovi]MCM5680240.1 carotenoid 1,2-hydratase [Caldimonas mangrovi]
MRRRHLLQWLAAGAPFAAQAAPVVQPGAALAFPRDFGAHPDYRTEWWYITGALQAPGREFGFQLTFFRSRVDTAQGNPSRFAATQLLFAHAALTDLQGQRLVHDQRIARAGFGIAEAAPADTDVKLRDWVLRRRGPVERSVYEALLPAQGFGLDLRIRETQPVLLQGQGGYSRKGPHAEQASYYYSQPQLDVQGRVSLGPEMHAVQGRAWLDHEWSETLLDDAAVGWDWIGMNFDDGAALTAFRLRRRDGSTLWAGGSYRPAGGEARAFEPGDVHFTPGRRWTSAATGASYPVEWQVDTPAGRHEVRARLDAQELDSRGSSGAVYWEGLSTLLDAQGRRVGGGYLEMTGYADRLRL